jgi:GT2 family glycosyltransferase
MLITASIVLYNNDSKKLSKLITSLDSSKSINKVFIYDNSETNSSEYLFISSEKYEYRHLKVNLGFGAAHNLVLDGLESDYHFFINPDIYFQSSEIDKMLVFMEKNSQVGLLSPQILFPNNEIQYLCKLNPSFFSLLIRRFAPLFIKKFFNQYLENYEMRYMNYSENFESTYLSGCFMLFRKTILDQIKGFDDNFFLYLEDADITLRASKISKTMHFADAKVYHFWEKGSYKSFKLALINFQSLIYYFKKHGFRLF